MFSSWINIQINYPSLLDVEDIINSSESEAERLISDEFSEQINFSKKINVQNLDFYYLNKNKIFDKANIELIKGKSYGIIGPSGAGKSTFIDLITGLIKPKSGRILIDDKELKFSNLKSWQKKISFVPQDPIILDASVYDNIVFNEENVENIDTKVNEASKLSQSYEFIENMEKKFQTIMGERGIRISGGQKQRISIARGLLRESEILIFDESTNAVDSITEKKIIENILNFYKEKLILIISHRETIYDKLDLIIQFKNGKIKQIK